MNITQRTFGAVASDGEQTMRTTATITTEHVDLISRQRSFV
jgi:hypothetical protein